MGARVWAEHSARKPVDVKFLLWKLNSHPSIFIPINVSWCHVSAFMCIGIYLNGECDTSSHQRKTGHGRRRAQTMQRRIRGPLSNVRSICLRYSISHNLSIQIDWLEVDGEAEKIKVKWVKINWWEKACVGVRHCYLHILCIRLLFHCLSNISLIPHCWFD